MKKGLIVFGVLLAVLAVAGTAFVVNAQNNNPPSGDFACPGWDGESSGWFGRHGMMGFWGDDADGRCPGYGVDGEYGPMHEAMTQALSDATGLTVEEINERLANGEHHFEIALDAGLTEEDLQALMQAVYQSYQGSDESFMPHHGGMYRNWSGDGSFMGGGCHGGRWVQPETGSEF